MQQLVELSPHLDAALGAIPDKPMGALSSLVAEGDLRAFDSKKQSMAGRAYYVLGMPAAGLAATASATGLISTSGRIPAAIIALVSSGLTAAAAFLNSEQNRKRSDELSAAWQALADDARIKLLQGAQRWIAR